MPPEFDTRPQLLKRSFRSGKGTLSLLLWQLFLAVQLCLAPALAQSGPATSWRAVKIGGGGFVSGILCHPTERNLAYARTDVGGIYRWEAGSSKWIALNDDIGGRDNEFMHLGILSFAVDPNDSNRLCAVGGQYVDWWAPNAIFLSSSDRGATWTKISLSFKTGGNQDGRNTGEHLAVDPNDGRILFLGTNQNGLWKSTDRGETWSQVTNFTPTSCTLVLFDKTTGNSGSATQTVFVGVNSTTGNSLYRSTDGGSTWAAVPGQPSGSLPHHADIGYGTPRILYLAYGNGLGPNSVTAGSVWKLDLSSGTWTNISPSTGSYGFGGLSVDASDPNRLVVSTLDRWSGGDAIYRSTNGGSSWTEVLLAGSLDHTSTAFKSGLTPHWIGDVKIDPFAPGRAMFVTGYGLYATDQLASSNSPVWRFFNDGLEESVPQALVSPTEGAPLLSVIGDFGGFRHDDLDALPLRFSVQDGTNTSIDFSQALPSFVVRTSNTSTRGAYSLDGGTTWTAFGSASASSAEGGTIAVSADGSRLVWTQRNSATYYSTNRGAAWTSSTGAPSGSAPVSDRVNSSRFYSYHSGGGRVYVSNDGGVTFSAGAIVPSGGSAMRAVPGYEGHLWIPCLSNGLQRSIDGGASFSRLSSITEAYAVGFGKAADGQSHPAVYVWGKVGSVVGIYRSSDTGATWTRINDDLHQFGYINVIAGDARTYGRVYLATSGRGVVVGELQATPTAPAIDAQPESLTLTPGSTATFHVTASGTSPLSYQWFKDGIAIPGATDSTLILTNVQEANIGSYAATVVNSLGSLTTSTATLALGSATITALSVRAQAGTGDNTLFLGVIFSGSAQKYMIVRALGPNLDGIVTGFMQDPKLSLYVGGNIVLENDNWVDSETLRTRFAAIGMMPLAAGSKDAVVVQQLNEPIYTIGVGSVNGASGVAMAEVYDSEPDMTGRRLSAVAVRNFVGNGDSILIAGIIISGNASRQILIRGLGPDLAGAVADHLHDPYLKLHNPNTGVLLGENDDWQDDPDVGPALSAKGFPALPNGSKDAAMYVTLAPGLYTISLLGKNSGTGIGQIDVYEAH